MAFKMKGAPMYDTSSKHGTNANYKKSGPPNLLGKILDPLGLKKKLMGGGKDNCPPQQQQVIGGPKPVEPVTPNAVSNATTTNAPGMTENVDPAAQSAAGGATMKKGLKNGAPKKTDPKDEEKNEFGETPEQYKQRMIDMGLRKSDAKEEIDSKENKKASKRDKATEKPGAPAIWPFKKKVKTSGAVLDRERKKKSRGKNIKTSNNKLRNAFNKTTKKISDKIQEPGKKGNRPGFD